MSKNALSDLILVLYNFGLMVGWMIFAFVFFNEIGEHGWIECTKNPHQLHKQSINVLGFNQYMQFLNVIFAIVGITRTNLLNEFLQQLARGLFAFITLHEVDTTKGPWVTTAMCAFAIGETARYPYYFIKTLGMEKTGFGYFLGHFRYNFFLIFYPVGAFCDAMTHLYAGENMRKSGKYHILLPNRCNFCFDLPFLCENVLPQLYFVFLPMNYILLVNNRSKYYDS